DPGDGPVEEGLDGGDARLPERLVLERGDVQLPPFPLPRVVAEGLGQLLVRRPDGRLHDQGGGPGLAGRLTAPPAVHLAVPAAPIPSPEGRRRGSRSAPRAPPGRPPPGSGRRSRSLGSTGGPPRGSPGRRAGPASR